MTQDNKIAILHYAGPPIVGGVEATIYHHARLFVDHGFSPQILVGRGGCFYPGVVLHHIPEIDSRHKEVIEIGEALASGNIPTDFYHLRDLLAAKLRPILAASKICLVHNVLTLHKNMPLTAALHMLAEEAIVPYVGWCHDFAWRDQLYADDLHSGYPWDLLREPWPGVAYVAVSKHRRTQLAGMLSIPEESIQVINPGVDIKSFLKIEDQTWDLVESLELLDMDPLLLLPARITRRKNIEFAIEMMSHLVRERPECGLVVTGPPGPHNPKNKAYLDQLLTLVEDSGLKDHVFFLYQYGDESGPLHVTDAMMADLYRLADALIFPSRKEGFGIPIIEAGLSRLPIFAANIPPVVESTEGYAHLFNLDSAPQQAADDVVEILSSSETYQFQKKVVQKYSWENIFHDQIMPIVCD